MTNLGTLPGAFVNPSTSVLLHTHGTGVTANNYPQPLPEYLAYLGVPLIILLLVAIVYFWRHLAIRVARHYLHSARVARDGIQTHPAEHRDAAVVPAALAPRR